MNDRKAILKFIRLLADQKTITEIARASIVADVLAIAKASYKLDENPAVFRFSDRNYKATVKLYPAKVSVELEAFGRKVLDDKFARPDLDVVVSYRAKSDLIKAARAGGRASRGGGRKPKS